MKIGVKQYEMRHVVRLTARCNVNEINDCTVEPLIDFNHRNSLFFPLRRLCRGNDSRMARVD